MLFPQKRVNAEGIRSGPFDWMPQYFKGMITLSAVFAVERKKVHVPMYRDVSQTVNEECHPGPS
jgi:hypothetical protein